MAPVLLRHRIFRRIGLPGRVLRRLCDLLDRVFLFFVTPGLTLSDLKSVDDGRVQSQQSLVDSLQALVHRQDSIIDELQARLSDENRFTRDALAGIGEHLKKLEQRLDHYPRELTDTLEQAEAEQMGRMNQALADVSQLRQQFGYYQRSHQLALESLDKLAASDHPLHGTEALRSEVEKQKEAQLDAYYVAFEDACRGSRKEIKAGLQHYSPLFKELQGRKLLAEKPVVDLGCGRGEWLELLEEWGWQALGIDLNQIMVEVCGEFGLKAQCQDALQYLKSLPDNSLAAITGFHIIEHLPFDLLHGLFNESMRVIRGGGIILFETPNPENVLVGSHTFYHDFTHRNPITPSSITFLAEYFGFTEIEIIRSHPYPEDARVPGNDPLTERVNGHLCGPQDFAILARKPLIDKSGRLLNV
ncbi:MAG: hypothetical protein CSB48_09690 [Proteobacteria bacterium]|nr:MAG: hypothetical protein CSB48_09690 [Pseudomonadota bacterium]